jgi:hypothetical protein
MLRQPLHAAEAEASLNHLHYRSEAVFPFERYITRMSECFELMEDNQQGFSEPQKVKKMLDGVVYGVVLTNAEVVAIKVVVRLTHPNDFNHASTLMSGQIALLFPAATSDLRNFSSCARTFCWWTWWPSWWSYECWTWWRRSSWCPDTQRRRCQ